MIGVFGGTFNPVHWGHIRTALEIKKALAMDSMLLVPCGIPPHREQPDISASIRLAMLQAAVAEYHQLHIDERELRRPGPSYSVDTLQSLREENGDTPIGLCVGVDAFIHLDSWHEWQRLLELAHIIVVHRPGWPLESLSEQLSDGLRAVVGDRVTRDVNMLRQRSGGLILPQKVTEIDISSSDIRRRVAQGESIAGCVPPAVAEIIQQLHLYQTTEKSG